MLLGRTKILAALATGEVFCTPTPARIEGTHIDVALGRYSWLPVEHADVLELADADPARWYRLFEASSVVLIPPRTHALAHTEEFIGTTVPHINPMLDTRSTTARWGLQIHLSAGLGDPGFHSRWTLEIYNPWPSVVAVPVGARVGSVSFEPVDGNDELYEGRYNQRPEDWTPASMLPRRGNW